jgi:hypothetical protein
MDDVMTTLSAKMSGVAVFAAQDIFETVAGPATRAMPHAIRFAQSSDDGDVAD